MNDGRASGALGLTLSLDFRRAHMQLRQQRGIPGNKPSFRWHFVSLANNL